MSVKKPKLPRLTPTTATLNSARTLAAPSIFPSPPTTMAKSACLPISVISADSKPLVSNFCAVFVSTSTRQPRLVK